MKRNLRVAIQGVRASFHDVAAQKYFTSYKVESIECDTFKMLCEILKKGKADFAIMAIENSIAGSILPNYTLLESYKFSVVGEIYSRIDLFLMAQKGENLKTIKQVISHPMALAQCTGFLNRISGVKVIETNDTAESAKEIHEKKLKHVGAVASHLAAKTYGLKILAAHIENDKKNFTRFFVVSKNGKMTIPRKNKASLRFELLNRSGSLLEALKVIHQHEVNMTKIQSVPIVGKPYQYSFHVDVELRSSGQLNGLIKSLKRATKNLRILGAYKGAKVPT